jgi:hypothetical protein
MKAREKQLKKIVERRYKSLNEVGDQLMTVLSLSDRPDKQNIRSG